MVKLLPRKGKPKGYNFVYSSENIAEAEFWGTFSDDGYPVPTREIKGQKKPDEYLWALSPNGRYTVPKEDMDINVKAIQLKDGRTGYVFSFE